MGFFLFCVETFNSPLANLQVQTPCYGPVRWYPCLTHCILYIPLSSFFLILKHRRHPIFVSFFATSIRYADIRTPVVCGETLSIMQIWCKDT